MNKSKNRYPLARGLSQDKIGEVVTRYQSEKISAQALAIQYGVSRSYITKILKKNSIEIKHYSHFTRKYPFNERFFDVIDTEEKAYFLGFLYADGCNSLKTFTLKICLQERDMDILEKFKNLVECQIPLGVKRYSHKNKNWQNQRTLSLYSKKLSIRANELGCIPNKSLTLLFPDETQVPNYLLRHFIRGYFDGDGHITDFGASAVVSSRFFIKSLHEIITKLKIKSKIYDCKNPLTKRLIIGRRLNSLKFLDWIYQDSTVFLKRKHDKYLSIDRILRVNQFG